MDQEISEAPRYNWRCLIQMSRKSSKRLTRRSSYFSGGIQEDYLRAHYGESFVPWTLDGLIWWSSCKIFMQ